MSEPEIRLEDLRRVSLKPGDVLVLQVPYAVGPEWARKAEKTIEAVFPEHKCLVLDSGITLEVREP